LRAKVTTDEAFFYGFFVECNSADSQFLFAKRGLDDAAIPSSFLFYYLFRLVVLLLKMRASIHKKKERRCGYSFLYAEAVICLLKRSSIRLNYACSCAGATLKRQGILAVS
jgi:hypothetical protein